MFSSGGRVGAEIRLIAGVTMLYIVTRSVLTRWTRLDGATPRRRAVAQWLPILAATVAATALRQTGIAIGVIFGSSVACLSLVPGLSGYVAPPSELPASRRVWSLVLPAAMLVLLIGFHGFFTWYHAVMLGVMGAVFFPVWMEQPAVEGPPEPMEPKVTPAAGAMPAAAFACALIGGWIVVSGAVMASDNSQILSGELLATAVLSPMLLLPSLGSAAVVAQRGQTGKVLTALSGTVLLNLCVLLPAVILWNLARFRMFHGAVAGTGAHAMIGAHAMTFPMITWRVDSVVLVILGFALAAFASGRRMPERLESLLLLFVYVAYLVAETWFTVRVKL